MNAENIDTSVSNFKQSPREAQYRNITILGMRFEIAKPVFSRLSRKWAEVLHMASMIVLILTTLASALIVIKILSVFIDSVPVMTVLSLLSELLILSLSASVFSALLEEHRWNFGGKSAME
ncbi:hypothetical protein DMB44_05430 [Thermoplasma sp. Kam2015]|uniref:hypothetical protein n=1 Tax=Thermoplasma sp. Kam2015 TaxID=2094122 RepID=UPI000D916B91|nr:hypothetical protein [Thermoplasma sp. Kam2015]PYB68163.1 hypothetical protein DMB44_05430 [Thermoplasma sp. Kam2015]